MKTVIAIGVVLATIRIWIGLAEPPQEFNWLEPYKDLAHIFIGGLGIAWWYDQQRWQWYLFWFLCLVEVVTALYVHLPR